MPIGGPLGPGGLGGPMAPTPRMASPETVMRPPSPSSPDSRTVLASPLADRLGGPLQQQQRMAQLTKMVGWATKLLGQVANQVMDTSPKQASELKQIEAKLIRWFPPQPGPPTSPAGVQGMAARMPMSGGGAGPAGAMPPAAGGAPMSGPMPGL